MRAITLQRTQALALRPPRSLLLGVLRNSTVNTGPGAAPLEEPLSENDPHNSSGGETFPVASVGCTLKNTESEGTYPEEPFTGRLNNETLGDTPPSVNTECISVAPESNGGSEDKPFNLSRLINEDLGSPQIMNPGI